MFRKTQWAAVFVTALFAGAGVSHAEMAGNPFADGTVSADGSIRVPEDFRNDFVALGTWSVIGDADTGDDIGLHVVYAPKSAVEGYRETGAFPDGTVLVKELFNTETERLTTGEATHATAVAGYFVMVKDNNGRFPENPLWGDGWGWSFFDAGNPARTVSTDYQSDCLGCHEPARSTDLVFIQAYPVLE